MAGFLVTDARPITDALRNVALFTPTAASARRYADEAALSVVLVEYAEGPGKLTIVATDRYQLAHQTLVIDAGGEPFAFTLPASEAARIASAHGAAHHGISVKIEGTELRAESDKGASVHPIDPDGRASFPPWRRVLSASGGQRGQFRRLAARAARKDQGQRFGAGRRPHDPDRPRQACLLPDRKRACDPHHDKEAGLMTDQPNKAAWRGTIAFGLATIPVGLHTAVRPHAVHLSSVHRGCGGKVRMRKVCEIHGTELTSTEIQRAAPSGMPIDDSALESLPVSDKRTMTVRGFAPADGIDPAMLGRPYHVDAEPAGRRAYALLRAAMARTRSVAVATVAFTGGESLAILRPDGPRITLQLVAWPDEIVAPSSPEPDCKVAPAELATARELIQSMRVDIAAMRDDHNEAMQALVASLPAPVAAPVTVAGAAPVDLMAALEASVKAARKPRARKG